LRICIRINKEINCIKSRCDSINIIARPRSSITIKKLNTRKDVEIARVIIIGVNFFYENFVIRVEAGISAVNICPATTEPVPI